MTLLVTAACLTVTSCAGSPIDPSLIQIFSGRLSSQAAVVHTFEVSQNGAARITLVNLGPQADVRVGMAVGPVLDGVCSATVIDETMAAGDTLVVELGAGEACVSIYLTGEIAETSVSYELELVHP